MHSQQFAIRGSHKQFTIQQKKVKMIKFGLHLPILKEQNMIKN